MAAIPHYDLSLDYDQTDDGAKEIIRKTKPLWNLETLKFHRFTGGQCNILLGCYQPDDKDDMVIVRVFGVMTERIVDRKAEQQAFILLSKAGCSPPLYCTFNNGMAYGFVKGEPLARNMIADKNIRTLIAKEMAKYHTLKNDQNSGGDNPSREPMLIAKMQDWLTSIPEGFPEEERQKLFVQELKSKTFLKEEFEILRKHLENMTCDVVLCHNDLLLQNIIYDSQTNKIGFIDYEYVFYNFQPFEIGNHFNEYAGEMDSELDYSHYPDREYQLSWIRTYLEEYNRLTGKQTSPSDRDVERLYVQANKCALASHFFWGLCTLIMAESPRTDFDFLGYGVTRFRQYFKRRDEFLALKEP